tara:strand:- start:1633 stop:2526 length:894 start_codon:yes stop_codon:yes gene_type:complete
MRNFTIIILCSFIFCQAHKFDGDAAFSYLVEQCEFGPRYPGSEGHKNAAKYFYNHFSEFSDSVIIYSDIINHPVTKEKIEIKNFLIHHNIESKERYLFMAHWDTRDRADKDSNIENINNPIIGANDGASGVALLMELSKYLNKHPLKNIGIDILLIDAEDMGRSGHVNEWGLGTQSFVKQYNGLLPKYAICVDMIADKNPVYKIEGFSYQFAKDLVHEIWTLANNLGYKEFKWQLAPRIYDDHVYYYYGTQVPAIDIIDFDFPEWHTMDDTIENCSPKGLFIVGNVLLEFIYRRDQK